MARKAWSELSPAYQKRLRSKGIGPAQHRAGASIKAARGHAATPEHNIWRRAAVQKDILKSIPGFKNLPPAEAEVVGKQWILGFMSRAAGPLEPVKISDWRYGMKDMPDKVRYQTDDQVNARLELNAWLDAHPEALKDPDGNDADFWHQYKANYMESFSRKS
jgi:hypothetical protein